MSEFNDPAYPICHVDDGGIVKIYNGMTIRQQAVLMMAQGFAANSEICNFRDGWRNGDVAVLAVELADACLRAERETRG